jgi:3-oxoacyl-ACP reductase-like protein
MKNVIVFQLLAYLTRALVVAAAAPATGNRPAPNNSDAASDAIEVLLQGKLSVEDIVTLSKSVIDRIQALHSRARLGTIFQLTQSFNFFFLLLIV